eukprot:932998-Pelagomonas_calceolata.AAC.4
MLWILEPALTLRLRPALPGGSLLLAAKCSLLAAAAGACASTAGAWGRVACGEKSPTGEVSSGPAGEGRYSQSCTSTWSRWEKPWVSDAPCLSASLQNTETARVDLRQGLP